MGASEQWHEAQAATPRVFATTLWSVVRAAGDRGSGDAQGALEELCRAYWYPIFVYVRRKGHGPDEAQDLTQEFFAQLIKKEHLRLADPHKGRFRTFLLTMLDHFLASAWSRAHRQKRGGKFTFVPWDECALDGDLTMQSDQDAHQSGFDRQWALTLLKRAMNRLEADCRSSEKAALFREIKGLLSGEHDARSYSNIVQRLGMSEGAFRVAVHRFRQHYAKLVRHEIAQTVARPEDVDDELRHLLQVLSR